jgi:hypothetical protein
VRADRAARTQIRSMTTRGIALAAVLALAPLACATSSGSTQQSTGLSNTGLLGKAESYAGIALTAAKNYLAQSATPQQPSDKQAAAQAGVTAANTQAQKQEGSPLSQLEQNALLDWVKSRI